MKNNQFKKNCVATAILVGSVCVTNSAMAQNSAVTIHSEEVSITSVTTPKTGGKLTQIGTPVAHTATLKGFAKDLPLISVMKQIIPNGWIVKKNESNGKKLNTDVSVSWNGGKNWVDTLATIVENNNMDAIVNWNNKEVILMTANTVKKVEVKEQKSAIFELANDDAQNTSLTVGASEQAQYKAVSKKVEARTEISIESKPVIKALPVATWVLASGSLKENVEKWAKQAGYRVVWTGADYPVDEPATPADQVVLIGGFDAENGPISQLAVDYGPKSRVEKPLSFQFFQNKTLVVENFKYEQTGFPRFSNNQ